MQAPKKAKTVPPMRPAVSGSDVARILGYDVRAVPLAEARAKCSRKPNMNEAPP